MDWINDLFSSIIIAACITTVLCAWYWVMWRRYMLSISRTRLPIGSHDLYSAQDVEYVNRMSEILYRLYRQCLSNQGFVVVNTKEHRHRFISGFVYNLLIGKLSYDNLDGNGEVVRMFRYKCEKYIKLS